MVRLKPRRWVSEIREGKESEVIVKKVEQKGKGGRDKKEGSGKGGQRDQYAGEREKSEKPKSTIDVKTKRNCARRDGNGAEAERVKGSNQ